MIYLLGISHHFQVRTFISARAGGLVDFDIPRARCFEGYLDRLVDQLKPQAICEEDNETTIAGYSTIDDRAYSIPKHVSDRHNVRHVFCDPDQRERDDLYAAKGTTEAEDEKKGFPVREEEWLTRITSLLPDTLILFICGANHVESFRQKLEAKAVPVRVICQDLENELFPAKY